MATKKISFWSTTRGKTLKAAVYLAVSAFIGAIIAAIAQDPVLFGPFTIAANIILVFVKNLVDKNVPN